MKLNKMVETLNEIVYALKQHKIVINLFVLTFLHFDIFYGISTKILINMQQANRNRKTIIILLIDRRFEYYQVAILSRNKDILGVGLYCLIFVISCIYLTIFVMYKILSFSLDSYK